MSNIGIKDIANIAGVSIATVSRTLRDPSVVAKSTREKVLSAVKKSGYTPNNLGVSLRTSKSGNIVVIIPDISDSFNSGLIKAMEHTAHKHGYSILLGDSQGQEEREKNYAAMVKSKQADGIILFSHRLPFDIDKNLPIKGQIPPLVNSCESVHIDGIPSVMIDNVQAAKDAVNHLITLGHTRIAAITGDMNSPSSQDRLKGYKAALKAAKTPCNPLHIKQGTYTISSGEHCAEELLIQKERPTAIFCFSDEIALGCYSALKAKGFDIPEDISVIGFDNSRFSSYFSPPLTTISQPVAQIGEICITLLTDLIKGKEPERTSYVLPHELMVRKSTKSIK